MITFITLLVMFLIVRYEGNRTLEMVKHEKSLLLIDFQTALDRAVHKISMKNIGA